MIPLLAVVAALLLVATAVFAGLWIRDRRRAARAHDAKETFFDLVTHELRSPLSAILGYHELLQDGAYGEIPEGAEEPLSRVGRSARHLLHLIDGVVELSRIRSGTVRPELDHVNLGDIFPAVADAFRLTARERSIEPRVHITDALPVIRSDQDRILRALDLLVTSAVKHPAGTEIALHVTTDDHGATVRVTGTEIQTSEELDDPALQLGIRLAVADAIARVLGGSLTFETDDHNVIRALSFRIPDRAHDLAPGSDREPAAGPAPDSPSGL